VNLEQGLCGHQASFLAAPETRNWAAASNRSLVQAAFEVSPASLTKLLPQTAKRPEKVRAFA